MFYTFSFFNYYLFLAALGQEIVLIGFYKPFLVLLFWFYDYINFQMTLLKHFFFNFTNYQHFRQLTFY